MDILSNNNFNIINILSITRLLQYYIECSVNKYISTEKLFVVWKNDSRKNGKKNKWFQRKYYLIYYNNIKNKMYFIFDKFEIFYQD